MSTEESGSVGAGVVRALFGRPRLWTAAAWAGVGVLWLTRALAHPTWFHVVATCVFLLGGIGYGVVALRDRARGTGSYAEGASRRRFWL